MRDEAVAVLQQLEKDFRSQPDVLNSVASLYSLWAMDSEASDRFERSVRLDPVSARPKLAMGISALMRGDHEEAVRALQKALELDPGLPNARVRLGEALANEGRMEEAVKELELHVKRFPRSTEGLFRLGQAYFHVKQYGKAKECQERVIQLDPEYAPAFHALANVCEAMGLRAESDKHRRRFAELGRRDPDPGRTYRERIDDVNLAQGNLAETHLVAAKVYQAAAESLRVPPPTDIIEKHLRAAARANRKDRQSRAMLLDLYDKANRIKDAVEVLNDLVALEPKEPLHRVNRGSLLVRLKMLDEAEDDFRQAVLLAPNDARGYAKLAMLRFQHEPNLREARKLMQTAVRLAPDKAEYHALLAEICASLQDRTAALEAIRRAAELEPDHPRVRRTKARLDAKEKGAAGDR